MGDDLMIVGEVKRSPIGSPPLKKLKQSRLPFSPVNSKSPNENEQLSNEKKRKHSGSDCPSSIPKTPRNESKEAESSCTDENLPAPKDSSKSTDDKSSEETKLKDTVGKKRGRPAGSKNKSKEESCTSPQSSSSPVLKKRGRISETDPIKSVDCSKSEKTESEEESVSKSRVLETESGTAESHSEQEVSEETESETEEGKIKATSHTSVEGNEKEVQASNEPKSVEKRSRGRPRKSLTPQTPKDAVPKKRGRPFGSKNKKNGCSSLDNSRCSDLGDEGSPSAGNTPLSDTKVLPKEKTRKFLALFASPNLVSSSQEKTNEEDNAVVSSPKTPVAKKVENSLCKEEEEKPKENDGKNADIDEEKKMKNEEDSKKMKNEEDSKKASNQVKEEKDEVKDKEFMSEKHHEDENDSKKCDIKEITSEKQPQDVAQMDSQKICSDSESSLKNDDSENHNVSESTELNESASAVEESMSESEGSVSKNDSLNSSSDVGKSPSVEVCKTPTSTSSKIDLFKKPQKLTPKQKEKEAAKLLKMEERAKQKQEKEKQLQEKQAEKERIKKQKEEEKQKQKEEKEKAREELRKKRQEELDAKRQKKEEEQQKKEEERLKKEEERLKKEEERLKKEEEKQKKIEVQQKIEEEKRKQSEKLKNKFASFFVAKKREAEDEGKDTEGPFKEFRVKEDMQLAPVVRNRLSETQLTELDEYMSGLIKPSFKSYLKLLKSENYIKGKSDRTWPSKKENEDEDDIMIVDEEEDDVGSCSDMIQDPIAGMLQNKKHRAKLLQFCENQRPAYWGTWSKKSTFISARHPFSKDEIFDYEYDSDDDWEEEEAGESLSDSEGEDKEEKEEGDQYEVDNDFFVPHGYLSDDEGKSDVEDDGEDSSASKAKDSEKSKNTEQLKQKQAEFEEEMKQKTKALKPRVIGCLWMADRNNNAAYDQLLKILQPHKAVTLCSQIPIGSRHSQGIAKECPENEDEEAPAEYRTGNSKRFVKTFPEEAIPALIKLLHGNRLGKPKLCYEFTQYWCKLTGGELEESKINQIPIKIQATESVFISKRRLGAKIQELGTWKRCLDESVSRHIMCWYVPKKIREEYGLGDLKLSNSWMYATNIKDKKEDMESEEDTPKRNKIRPITAFTKKIPSTPSSTNTSPNSTPSSTPLHNESKSENSPSLGAGVNSTPLANTSTSSVHNTPASAPDVTPARKKLPSGSKSKKKVNLFPVKVKETNVPQKGSIVSFFKKSKENSPQCSESESKGKSEKKSGASEEVITLD